VTSAAHPELDPHGVGPASGGDVVHVLLETDDPDVIASIAGRMEEGVSPRLHRQAAADVPQSLQAGSLPVGALVEGLLGWMERARPGRNLVCERDPEDGNLVLRTETAKGSPRLTIGGPGRASDHGVGATARADVDAAIRGLLELNTSELADARPARADQFLWEPFSPTKGFQGIARYVSPPALRALGLNAGVPEVASDDGMTTRQRAERLFDNLSARQIAYARDPWTGFRRRQQVRHPWWLVEDRWGTCLDLAVTYGAMCIQARIGTLLAIPRGHALVVIDQNREVTDRIVDPWERDWATRTATGVWRAEDPEAIAALAGELEAETLLAVDVVAITGGATFEDALRQGQEWLRRPTTLVDVPLLHTEEGFRPLPDPEERRRNLIRSYPQVAPDPPELYPSQQEVFDQLVHESGVVVLLGPQGQGKSTVARKLQLEAPFGQGWFLNASEPQTLISSLADADRAELNRTATGMAAVDRRGFYEGALQRLAAVPGRSIVVFDNADGDPGKITPLLPVPAPRQLVLITSTNSDWAQVPGIRTMQLPPIDDARVAVDLEGDDLVPIVDGRVLLLKAFRSLMNATGMSGSEIAGHVPQAGTVSAAGRGPATFWAALRAGLDLDAAALRLCLQCAYLPPDRQPLGAIEVLSPRAGEVVEKLDVAGLLNVEQVSAESTVVRMHRLFGAAVREAVRDEAPELDDDVVLELVTAPRTVLDVFDRYGDQSTLNRLNERLSDIDGRSTEPDLRLGRALHGLAALLELGGQTRPSGNTYLLAERHVQDRPELLADVLQSRARTVNQQHPRDEAKLRQALEWAKRAEQIMMTSPGGRTGADRCLAMQGLLLQKLARFPGEGETTVKLMHEALAVIEEAHRRRLERLDPMDPELARSEFNLAGPRVSLAQREPERAREHLDAAERVYVSVRERRIEIYDRDVHPHIAACIIGEAYVNYYRALLIPAPPAVRAAWLRTATERASVALEQRQALDGSLDLAESRKAVRFLAKVALARAATPTAATRTVESVADEVTNELAFAAVETLPSNARDLAERISAWLFSPALAAVVEAFEATPPASSTPLDEALEWFDEFSGRWDYRKGKERNLVTPQDLGPEVEDIARRAAVALGMVGTSVPTAKHYDHVLVLGGLVRACMARPIFAARLLEERTITADAVTALGGFRELKGDELELAARLGHTELTDEFDAMDAGTRKAFRLGAPLSERGERSDVVGASWAVREYSTSEGVPVRVVGAPSSEPGQRVQTADTYAWFGSELAKLRPGERVLIVTSDIYVPYQHAAALRMLGLPYAVEVDAVGVRPGDAHPDLAQEFKPHNYLQEMRSTIQALRALLEASKSG
jgi:hypothetical protein